MKHPLTERQQDIYDFIQEYQCGHGFSPKIREIQDAFSIRSVNGVIKHLHALEKKGWIQRDNTPRGISLLDKVKCKLTSTMSTIPIFGAIPAGNAQQLEEHVEGYHVMEDTRLGAFKDAFALRVRGESMIDAGIYDGDLVVAVQKPPRVGDIVVALLDGENTLKRFMKDSNGNPYLKAENEAYPEMYPIGSLEIQGVVVSLTREYN
ncbi:repressor LexA [Candidatus Gracilibacteria bacterium CG17_big_fil_post_rev_8_21_14_2_50_48_13]|nr:MAG: repressor LexA [Candidatus Gracilibacteria bacterium CG17_big_fil_post_rev_8_21_14_2_50_48_13]